MSDNTKMFTEDEKIIARNIDKKFEWMARDKNGLLYAHSSKPTKKGRSWVNNYHYYYYVSVSALFGQEMFKSIKWQDDEPTLIKDIYDPQILDEAEREYLKTVLKPFHEEVDNVKKIKHHMIDNETYNKEYLYIKFYDGEFTFPDFDAGKMYKGMEPGGTEPGREYTLDELGIKY